MYYLKDHARDDNSDWLATPQGEGEGRKKEEINDSNRINTVGEAITVARVRPPLGLLSVRMREYREKEEARNNGSVNADISKEGRLATPGVPYALFLHVLLTFVAGQSALVAKADIPQGPPSVLKHRKVLPDSNVKSRTRKPLAAANTNANVRKKSKATSRPSRRGVNHETEEKENLPHILCDSDNEVDDLAQNAHAPSAQETASKEQKQKQEYLFATIDTLPDPFVLTSEDECDGSAEGGQSDREGATTTNSDPTALTTAEPTDERNARAPKSCFRGAKVPPKGRTVTFKDPLIKFHFYYYPDPDDIWSRCGLSMRPTRKSFTTFLLISGHSPAGYSQTPEIRHWLIKSSPCNMG